MTFTILYLIAQHAPTSKVINGLPSGQKKTTSAQQNSLGIAAGKNCIQCNKCVFAENCSSHLMSSPLFSD